MHRSGVVVTGLWLFDKPARGKAAQGEPARGHAGRDRMTTTGARARGADDRLCHTRYMAGPYRDPELVCPACHAKLRVFGQRLCCDACDGILLELADLTTSIAELTGIDPE